jgi:hypothetical protein
MKPIQIILISIMTITLVWYFGHLKSRAIERIVFILAMIFGVTIVIYPDLATKIALMVGVGRGADLFIYLSVVFDPLCKAS